MADSAFFGGAATPAVETTERSPRHSATVRVTHWLVTVSFAGLLVSGIAILLAHPRLYWGETGGLGSPALVDLPLPLRLGQSGWGRSLHFLCAWGCVLTGMVYVASGSLSGHFSKDLMPPRGILARSAMGQPGDGGLFSYRLPQRVVYLVVVFLLFPLIVLSGLAMSPAIASVIPQIVEAFGGQQSARTVHFVAACLSVLFVIVHVAMVCRGGFTQRMRGMITGHIDPLETQK